MKKWVSGILLCAAAVSLAACGNKNASSGEGTEKAAEAGESRDSLGGQQENAANASKVYQIGFTTAAVEDDPYYVFAKNFSDIVAERTGGGSVLRNADGHNGYGGNDECLRQRIRTGIRSL